jgi:membrane associated rhomboid family serine protease
LTTYRNYGGGGGRRFSGGGGNMLGGLSFPPFTFAVKWLIIANTAVYLLMLLLGALAPGFAFHLSGTPVLTAGGEAQFPIFSLVPYSVVHGWIWQLVTYSFFHLGLFHILFNMLTLWMFGAQLEIGWKSARFFEFYFYAVIAAALTTVAISYLGMVPGFGFLGISPLVATVGASGGVYGLMVAFAVLYGDMEFMLFPLPFTMKAKYLVAIFILISLAGAFQGMGIGHRGESIAYFAHLGGALFGYIYVKFLPTRGLLFASSEASFGLRNRYQKWKRRRMARKFEVYMRKHDRSQFFDEYGNYRPPEEKKDNGGDSRPPWVN